MRVIEITETKMDKLSGHIEQGLRHLGKAMQYVDDWMQESGMNERRGGYKDNYRENYRGGGYGSRYGSGMGGYRDDDDDDWDEMNERRRRDSRGRYM